MRTANHNADVILIGGGIMSATLGAMLALSQPHRRIILLERAPTVACESSGPWNNAGTGHSGYCELNYMPDPGDGQKAHIIATQFAMSRRWWEQLADEGLLDLDSFLHTTPHMDVVFGQRDLDYLRARFATLTTDPAFTGMLFSDDPARIAEWAPLVMDGRRADDPAAATFHPDGTDIDFGALTRALTQIIADRGGQILLEHDVRSLHRDATGGWVVQGRTADRQRFGVTGGFVFVGAGGLALRLLQQARIPEVRGYAVLPVGAAFFRTSLPHLVTRHDVKVYGQAAIGAPPMSVPHLDKRVVDGEGHVMFGPYATFSTKLLKHGSVTDFFTTLRWRNLAVIGAALLQNLSLVGYLVVQLASGRRRKFRQLQQYLPTAEFNDWQLVAAGQRAQLVKPDRRRIGRLEQGTELVVSADGSIAGLLGASPGASTAVAIMNDLIARCFGGTPYDAR